MGTHCPNAVAIPLFREPADDQYAVRAEQAHQKAIARPSTAGRFDAREAPVDRPRRQGPRDGRLGPTRARFRDSTIEAAGAASSRGSGAAPKGEDFSGAAHGNSVGHRVTLPGITDVGVPPVSWQPNVP